MEHHLRSQCHCLLQNQMPKMLHVLMIQVLLPALNQAYYTVMINSNLIFRYSIIVDLLLFPGQMSRGLRMQR